MAATLAPQASAPRNLPDSSDGSVAGNGSISAAGNFTALCAIVDIPMLGARVVERPGHADGNVAVFRTADDRAFAVLDRCPHKGGPLSQGIVFGDRVACPLHNWSIELTNGCAVAPDEGCTRSFPVRVEQGVVYVALG
jgi:nitrite reductase (NADH) small subunit